MKIGRGKPMAAEEPVLPPSGIPDTPFAAPGEDRPARAPLLDIPYGFAREHGVGTAETGEPAALGRGPRGRGSDDPARGGAAISPCRSMSTSSTCRPSTSISATIMRWTAAAAEMAGSLDIGSEGISDLPTADDLLDSADDAPAIRLINGIIAEAARQGVFRHPYRAL